MKHTFHLCAAAFVAAVLSATSVTPAQTTGATSSATPTAPVPAQAPALPTILTEDPSVTKRAIEWVERVQNGDIDRSQLTAAVGQKFTPQMVAALKTRMAPLGQPIGAAFGGGRPVGDVTVYRYVVTFKVGQIQEYISFDKDGKLAGLVFTQ